VLLDNGDVTLEFEEIRDELQHPTYQSHALLSDLNDTETDDILSILQVVKSGIIYAIKRRHRITSSNACLEKNR